MNEERSQPTAHSMTSQKACFYNRCDTAPKWSIESSAPVPAPAESLVLYSCDDHYGVLTGKLRQAGTKYTLTPINGPHMVNPCACPTQRTPEAVFEEELRRMPRFIRWLVSGATLVVMIIIAPFVIIYCGGRWIIGHRPRSGGVE